MLSAGRRQRGLTLVELMIAGVISLLALSAVLTVYSATARHGALQLQSAHLNEQVLGMLHLIGRDLRRAGYRHFDPARESSAANPFQQSDNRLRVGASPGEPAGSCILFAYDLDQDGMVGVGQCQQAGCPPFSDDDNVEQFGFRLRDGAVQSRYGGAGLGCDAGYWQALSDPDIHVTRLRFALHTHCINLDQIDAACDHSAPQLLQRVVSIDIGARFDTTPDVALGLVQWVAVRNDRLREARR